jgi:hypothetical protein
MPTHEKIPEGLVEGYTGPRRDSETPVTAIVAGDNGASNDELKRANHGVSLEKPAPKQRKGPDTLPHRQEKNSPQSWPVHEDRCCNCTKKSTCRRSCDCQKAKRNCVSCDCFGQCHTVANSHIHCTFIATASGSDETPALAKALDFESLKSSDKNDNSSEKTPTEKEELDQSRGQPDLDQRLDN